MAEVTTNRTIAKNTVFLYIRMLFAMAVSLYTSRVILDVLGVDDYGLYQAVGGVVAMMSFLNSALSHGTSRFLTFELGTGNYERLERTFSSVMTAHILLALFIILVAETLGLWFVRNKLVIPEDRMEAAIIAYHFSILTTVIHIIQVPYNASIIAHERMNVYAYVSIIDVVLKLLICYLLKIGGFDKLALYAMLLCGVQTCVALIYRIYCVRKFSETHYRPMWDWSILKGVLGYSGWNLFANTALALVTQGASVLLNMFFTSATVTAMSISNQVNAAAQQFVNSFRTAANPQIVKKLAVGDKEGSQRLLLVSTKFSFYLMLLLSLPIFLVCDELLAIWLKEVPAYTNVFVRFTIVTCLFQVFDTSFYTALYAKGRIRENALISPSILFILFPIVYVLFKLGLPPTSLSIGLLVAYAILGLIVKPMLIVKIADYKWRDILQVFVDCLKVAVAAVILPLVLYHFSDSWSGGSHIVRFLVMGFVSVLCVCASVWCLGLTREWRRKVISFVRSKIHQKAGR
ncbi:MAG: MATE family efflux transporter [Bacteroidales bacterium]|nr:MATE family efflux transporter [Bacteroidales bacterium]